MLEHAPHACIHERKMLLASIVCSQAYYRMCMACSNMHPMHVYTSARCSSRASSARKPTTVCVWHARTCTPCMYTRAQDAPREHRLLASLLPYVYGMLEHAPHACIHERKMLLASIVC